MEKIYKANRQTKKLTRYNQLNNTKLYRRNIIIDKIRQTDSDKIADKLTDSAFLDRTYQTSLDYQNIFKNNLFFLLQINNVSVHKFVKMLNAAGIKLTFQGFYQDKQTGFYKINYVVFYACLFNIEPELLLCADLPSIWFEAYPEQAPEYWNSQPTPDEPR